MQLHTANTCVTYICRWHNRRKALVLFQEEYVSTVNDHQVTHREGGHFKETWHSQGPTAGWPQGWEQNRVLPSSKSTRGLLTSTRSLTWSSAGLPPLRDIPPPLVCPDTTSFCLLLMPFSSCTRGKGKQSIPVHFLQATHISETSVRALLSFPFSRCTSLFLLWKHFQSTIHPS